MSEGVAYKSVLKLADLGEPGFDGSADIHVGLPIGRL